ncbi:MAG: CidA/LrgA family protein [Lachnospiraceae bacterium]|nr:CidA/LrgA family protein [Lachnospiraceae bacterium]
MKYLKQLSIILVVSLIAEAMGYYIPIPCPASVYGLIIMFILLCTKVIKLDQVEDTADFLIKVMPFIFVAPTVALMTSFDIIKGSVFWLFVMCFVSTIAVTAVTGLVAQLIIRIKKKGGKKNA